MGDGTHISWADATWNPITGCMVTSPGCVPCYAMKLAGTRLRNHPSRTGLTLDTKAGPVWNGEVRFNEQWLDQPLRWRKSRFVFVVAHGDLFYEKVPLVWQRRVLDVAFAAKWHAMLILTKRPEVMLNVLVDDTPKPHVWLGCSIEDDVRADERYWHMKHLADRGWNTWVSYEPALTRVGWGGWSFLRWMVAGGQSDTDGKSARPAHPDWFRETRDWCLRHSVPFHFKQWGAWIDADQWFDTVSTGPGKLMDMGAHGSVPWMPARPLNFSDARMLAFANGRSRQYQHRSDGGTDIRVGARAAGALLDGREWRQFPASER